MKWKKPKQMTPLVPSFHEKSAEREEGSLIQEGEKRRGGIEEEETKTKSSPSVHLLWEIFNSHQKIREEIAQESTFDLEKMFLQNRKIKAKLRSIIEKINRIQES